MGSAPDDPDYDLADPMRHVPLDVPAWLVHAADDPVVPISQSRDYVAAARRAGAEAELVEVEGGHFGVIDVEAPAWADIVAVLDEHRLSARGDNLPPVPARLRVADPATSRRPSRPGPRPTTALLVKHFLAVLAERAPGNSVEVRVPPSPPRRSSPASGTPAAPRRPSSRPTRGPGSPSPAASSPGTRPSPAAGSLASGERTDLTPYLPLTTRPPRSRTEWTSAPSASAPTCACWR